MPFTAELIMSNRKEYRYDWIWEKSTPLGFLNANRMPLRATENVSVFYRKPPVYNPQMWVSKPYIRVKKSGNRTKSYGTHKDVVTKHENGERFPTNVLKFANITADTTKYHHPTQKPVPLLEYLIKTYTNPGETVLDNCMGSGSTGVACVNTGRDFIGIELDPGYFDTAKKRIEDAQAQIRLKIV